MTPPAGAGTASSDDFQPMPQMPDPTQMNRRATDLQNLTWREYLARLAVEWVRDHGITGVLLAVFLYAAYEAIKYSVITGIPAAIAQVQAGFERNMADHKEVVKALTTRVDKIEENRDKQIGKVTESMDKIATSTNALVEEIRREREFRKRGGTP